MVEEARANKAKEVEAGLAAEAPTMRDEGANSLSASNEQAKAAAMNDAVGSLLGSRPGLALRRALCDIDSTDLTERLVSSDGRPLRHAAALALSEALSSHWKARRAASKAASAESSRPVSEAAMALREQQGKRRGKVTAFLVKSHLSRQLQSGFRGAWALASMAYLVARIALGAIRQSALRSLRKRLPWMGGRGGASMGASDAELVEEALCAAAAADGAEGEVAVGVAG